MAEVSEDKRDESLSERDVSDDDYVEVTVLSTGRVLEYVVPSFPVYKATLREMKLQWEEADGTIHVFDGFARVWVDKGGNYSSNSKNIQL